jgi:alpha-tubulin suppressor-like RCC1 family protein
MTLRSQLASLLGVVACVSCGGSKGSGPGDAGSDGAFDRSASCRGVAAIRGLGDVWALKLDGSVWRWGVNPTGQLGDGTLTDAPEPIEFTSLGGGILEISPGAQDTFARTASGTVYAWGNNSNGQLGTPQATSAYAPVAASLLGTDIVQVSPGQFHTCALRTDGSLWCWGQNDFGEVGDGTTTQRMSPVQVASLGQSVAEVSAGVYFTCARKIDGTLWCWGTNGNGRLGDGSGADQSTPVQVTALGNSAASIVATGYAYACAIDIDGAVWCWGWNVNGTLGDGTTTDRATPIKVAGLGAAVSKISLSEDHACAIEVDGSLWCWGNNYYAQLGDGTTTDRATPVEVTAVGSAVTDVTAGLNFTCALKADASVWCWGSDANGMLGDGTSGQRSTPAPVLGCP